ncbi:MAG: hypothetical protein EOO75_06425 [Myxococcales bacterium]|nr:MAG: hypothetical protein EOO75_06425 [Myxococcales bacterium]
MKNLMTSVVAVSLLAGAVWSVGCGDDGGGSGGSGGSGQGGDCSAFAEFLCGKLEECLPTGYEIAYTSDERCRLALRQQCEASILAPGSKATARQALDCIQSYASSCDTLQAGLRGVVEPAACRPPPGELADGAGCHEDTQCQSTSCSGSSSSCGVCQPLKKSKEGEECGSQGCESPLVCAKDLCVKAMTAGGACGDDDECASPLVCGKDPESVTGVCKAQGSKKAGEVCADSADCDGAQGSFCRTDKVCSTFRIARAGEKCGTEPSGLIGCEASTSCIALTCVVNAQDGEACDQKAGPRCNNPADCVNGKCTLPAAPTCN